MVTHNSAQHHHHHQKCLQDQPDTYIAKVELGLSWSQVTSIIGSPTALKGYQVLKVETRNKARTLLSLTESVFPFCRVGVLEDTFTCLGVLCAIVFFPIGILFCLALRQRRCPNCGAAFG
uniref:Membrane protein BRI3 n=1 Tax=Malurus cyaneus samueli TaxID=2593467 RepID=A0A8C5X4D0_9PASS